MLCQLRFDSCFYGNCLAMLCVMLKFSKTTDYTARQLENWKKRKKKRRMRGV